MLIIKEIGSRAFEDCHSLEKLIIPESLEKIGWNAFVYCNSLEIVVPSKLYPMFANSFPNGKITVNYNEEYSGAHQVSNEIPTQFEFQKNIQSKKNVDKKTIYIVILLIVIAIVGILIVSKFIHMPIL